MNRMEPAFPAFSFACPVCRTTLEILTEDQLRCPTDQTIYFKEDGIWRLLTPERQAYFRRFMQEYQTVRQGEGRGSADPAYYRALPYVDHTGRFQQNWQIRSKSFQALIRRVLVPFESELGRPLKALDLGAGNGWLAYRLAQRRYQVAALDLLTNPQDGLGAAIHYESAFTPVQADFDNLPFTSCQVDLAIFNAALHYSTDYQRTLQETLRVLNERGLLVILDTPVYHNPTSGARMVCEREAQFEKHYGFRSNALPSENFLTYHYLQALSVELELDLQVITPFYGLRWAARPWLARLRGQREPAKFLVIIGRQRPSGASL